MADIGTNTAFPVSGMDGVWSEGMNYREWLIGMAVAGLSGRIVSGQIDPMPPNEVAQNAIEIANWTISHLEKETD